MNENNSMAYTQNEDAQQDSIQNNSVYAKEHTALDNPASHNDNVTDMNNSAALEGSQVTVPVHPASHNDNVTDLDTSATLESSQMTVPVHPTSPDDNVTATPNSTASDSAIVESSNWAQHDTVTAQSATVQNRVTLIKDPIAPQSRIDNMNPAYNPNATSQSNLTYNSNTNPHNNSAYNPNANSHNDLNYSQNTNAKGSNTFAPSAAPQSNSAFNQNVPPQNVTAFSPNADNQSNSNYNQYTAPQSVTAFNPNADNQSNSNYNQYATTQSNTAYMPDDYTQSGTVAMQYNNTPLLQLNDLCKRYPGMGTYMSVFHMNLIIPRGRIIGLLGPNGCGKTTLIKMINGLLVPTCGSVLINGMAPCPATKKAVSYLPERTYLDNNMKVSQMVTYFADFYEDFSTEKAYGMLNALGISSDARLKTLSKGTKEKVQLILVMSRQADLYILDEPIAGVDPAARDYILRTIITNYNPGSTIILSTHLISDIENILDDVIFMKNGSLMLYTSVDSIRSQMGKSVDTYFREVYAC